MAFWTVSEDKGDYSDVWMIKITFKTNEIMFVTFRRT